MYIYFTYLITFYVMSGLCFIFDYFIKYDNKKIEQYKKINNVVIQNSFLYIPIISIPYEHFIVKKEPFNIYFIIKNLLFSIILLDFFFYYCHKIMHIPILYKWSHKLHHQYRISVGMEALYLHWFDLYFGNILPIYITMFNKDLYTNIIWTFITITSTIISHSNIIKCHHNDHHKYFIYNYGLGIYMDKLLNTINN